ncbi:hypothetical protein ASF48_18350 [Rathayibacter sp. Leaf299]|nr:hypothetical protein ASF48_18350 [Rathayibacter sp. Leaf299]
MPQPHHPRVTAITLSCLIAIGGIASLAPTASALPAVVAPTSEPTGEPTEVPEPTAEPTATAEPTVAPTASPTPTVAPTRTPAPAPVPTRPPAPTPPRPPAVPGDRLVADGALAAGESLVSANGAFLFVMQTDGNAVVYDASNRPVWYTGTSVAGSRIVLQADGNLVVYSSSNSAVWNSGTGGNPGARLVMQSDGNLVIYRADGSPAWATGYQAPPPAVVGDTLQGGGELRSDQRLTSGDGGSQAVMQADGNFVVYGRGGVNWNSGISGPGNRLVMQRDGNAVVYAAAGGVRWQSGTSGNAGARLLMQNDGNLVIYSTAGRPLWSTYVPPAPPAPPAPVIADVLTSGSELASGRGLRSADGGSEAAMQADGNLVVYSRGAVRWFTGTSAAGSRLVMQADGNAVVYSPANRPVWQSATSGNAGARMVMQNDGNLVVYSSSGRPLWQSNRPAPAPAPAPAPGPAPAPAPAPDGSPGDIVNCGDFASQPAAQAWFLRYRAYGDPGRLDGDNDGTACESYNY